MAPSMAGAADKSAAAYERARVCYKDLMTTEKQSATVGEWDQCMAEFERIHAKFPKGEKAPHSLFSVARLSQELYTISQKQEDLDRAIKKYNQLVREYPKSNLADDALYKIGCIRRDLMGQMDKARKAFAFVVENYPDGDITPRAREDLAALAEGSGEKAKSEDKVEIKATEKAKAAPAGKEKGAVPPAQAGGDSFSRAMLTAVDVSTSGNVTSVQFTLDKPVEYSLEFTEQGGRTKSPPELDITLLHASTTSDIARERAVESKHLAGFTVKKRLLGSGIRVEFTLMPGAEYAVSREGSSITVRFGGKDDLKKEPSAPIKKRGGRGKSASILNIKIVIDPGHGGDDTGAIGPSGTQEKDVTLAISRRLAARLEEETGARVWLTRNDDRTLSLEERDAIAVSKKADLFISIHANAANQKTQSGFETYYLDNATDEAAARLARRENKATQKKLSTAEHILSTMLQNYDTEESRELAKRVQSTLAQGIVAKNSKARDRGVRSALFYVLVGAKCPAILVETSFISNPREEKLLTNGKYQRDLASSITDGVESYVKARGKQYVSL